jgi:prephenate dehydrogenase
MSAAFPHVTILGGGLLGGSLALALARGSDAPVTTLWVRREASLEEARAAGIPLTTTDLTAAIHQADLLVLAVPVGAMPALLDQALAAGLPASCLVTDVGSVKSTPHRDLSPRMQAVGGRFLGSHPMCGSERTGLAATRAALFEDAACLLTHDGHPPDPQDAAALERFWRSVGCRTNWMSASIHDEMVARISHLPHVLAAAAARTCLKDPTEGRYGGGGLRDTTRVAAGNPPMWAEILTENRQAVLGPLLETIHDLQEIHRLLEQGREDEIRHWLDAAKRLRDLLPAFPAQS